MKIFISWSGDTSKEVAEYLKSWIEQIIQAAEPWISVDIEKGKRWNHEISQRLSESKVGIFCITRDNLKAPWVLFEAGAIAKTIDSYVCTFLIDVAPTDLSEPLSLFQATKFTKEDIFKLLSTINQNVTKNGSKGVNSEALKSLFEMFYPKLEENIKNIILINKSKETQVNIRTERELLEEAIQLLRVIKRSNNENPLYEEAVNLLDFYAKKYAKMANLSHEEVGNDANINDFLKYIHDNPFLNNAFGGRDGLKNLIAEKYDSWPF